MARIDRRIVFLLIAIVVTIPLLVPVSFKVIPSEETLRFARAIDKAIQSPKPIMVEIVFGTQTMAEMEPIAMAVMHRLFHERKKAVFLTLEPTSAALIRRYLATMEQKYGLTYGEDYVFLGFASAYTVAIYSMGTSIEKYFHADDRGTPLSEIPLMKGVESLADVSAVLDIASNSNPQHWINYAVTPFGIDFLMACTAVQAAEYFPYIQTGQVKGLIAGGRAGAEYESILLDQGVMTEPGDAIRGLGSQSLALLTIVGLIVLGNLGYFASRRQTGER